MKKNIALIDFGAGNLHSVYKALKYIGADIVITANEKEIEKSDVVVFPGVGAFGAVMKAINENNLGNVIIKSAKGTKPFLGICVGMQVLFEEGEESPEEKGLGVFKGKAVKFKKAKPIPHVGWNGISSQKLKIGGLWSELGAHQYYFVHSYYVVPEDKNIIYAETEYCGEKFVSAIKKDNLLAVQFHPEKSGDAGLDLLREFVTT